MTNTCPDCGGDGKRIGLFPVYAENHTGARKPFIEMECPSCNGSGAVTDEFLQRCERGKQLQQRRKGAQIGLRQFAESIGVLPSVVCDCEHGRRDPEEIAGLYP